MKISAKNSVSVKFIFTLSFSLYPIIHTFPCSICIKLRMIKLLLNSYYNEVCKFVKGKMLSTSVVKLKRYIRQEFMSLKNLLSTLLLGVIHKGMIDISYFQISDLRMNHKSYPQFEIIVN